MPALTDPNLGLNYGWTLGESGWGAGMDANLKRLGAVVGLSVKSRAIATPPASPANGDRYIIPSGATGAWAGMTDQIAVRISGVWEYYTPEVGWVAYIEDEAKISVFTATGWSDGVQPALGTIATQNANAVSITGGIITGITDLAIADGGTGASTAEDARANLGLGTAATRNIGTSGANVPLLNTANTWSATQTFPGGVWNTSGNIGVGTTNPKNRLVSVANIGDAHASNLGLAASGSAQGQRTGMSFYPTFEGTTDNTPRRAADISAGFNGGSWGKQYLSFHVGNAINDAGNLTPECMRITAAGNVGIGTTTPSAKLQVNGPIRSTPVTVATLPSASAVGAGTRAWVTDSTLDYAAANIGTAVTGGGTNLAPVYSDGSTWRIG